MIARVLCSGLLVVAAIGCSPDQGATSRADPTPVSREGPTEQSRILAIARKAVEDNDTWIDSAQFEPPTREPDGRWSVKVWRYPKTPGGFRLVQIDRNGKVTSYMRGE